MTGDTDTQPDEHRPVGLHTLAQEILWLVGSALHGLRILAARRGGLR